jgi:hypothetical protein
MARRIRPVTYIWTGDAMVPLPRFKRQCDEQFVVHEEYPLTILEARSRASHSHYFACVHEGWANLPENIAHRFPTAEHLRKTVLVKLGYATVRTFACENLDHAMQLAAIIRSVDTYAVITVKESVVQVFDAKSQSAAEMGREEFQKSKDEVLQYIADLIGTSTTNLKKEGEKHFRPEPRKRQ